MVHVQPVYRVGQDCSTNGSFVNELKLLKERHPLADGDVLSLTKPAEDSELARHRVTENTPRSTS